MKSIALNLDVADAAILERAVASTLKAPELVDDRDMLDQSARTTLAYIQAELARMLTIRGQWQPRVVCGGSGIGRATTSRTESALMIVR